MAAVFMRVNPYLSMLPAIEAGVEIARIAIARVGPPVANLSSTSAVLRLCPLCGLFLIRPSRQTALTYRWRLPSRLSVVRPRQGDISTGSPLCSVTRLRRPSPIRRGVGRLGPVGAWFDYQGREIGDKCAWIGDGLQIPSSPFNMIGTTGARTRCRRCGRAWAAWGTARRHSDTCNSEKLSQGHGVCPGQGVLPFV